MKGSFSWRLYADVRVYTTKRVKFALDITLLKQKIKMKEDEIKTAQKYAKTHKANHEEFTAEISDLEGFIGTLRQEITGLSNDRMSISQAKRRLSKMKPVKR